MKFTISADSVGSGLGPVARAVPSRTSLPILSNVLITAREGAVDLTASSLELTIRHSLTAQVDDPGTIALPARLLAEFVSSLPGGDITCEVDSKTRTAHLQSGRFDAHIKGMDGDDFPPIADVADGETITVPGSVLLKAIDQTIIAASGDESRPMYTGALAQLEGSTLTLVATDGHRLATTAIALDGTKRKASEKVDVVIPSKALGEVSRLLRSQGDAAGAVTVTIGEGRAKIKFQVGSFEVISSLIDGAYPAYEKVIPTEAMTTVRASTAELRSTVKVVSLFARDAANVLKLEVSEGRLVMSANTNEVGDNVAAVDAGLEGEPVTVAFNARYVADVLGLIGSPEVEFVFNGPLSPGLVRDLGDPTYRYVVMPVRVVS